MIRIPVRLKTRPSLQAADLDANFQEIVGALDGGLDASAYARGLRLPATARAAGRSGYAVTLPMPTFMYPTINWLVLLRDPSSDLGYAIYPEADETRDLYGMYKTDSGEYPVLELVRWALVGRLSTGSITGTATLKHVRPYDATYTLDSGSITALAGPLFLDRALNFDPSAVRPGYYQLELSVPNSSFGRADLAWQLWFQAKHVR